MSNAICSDEAGPHFDDEVYTAVGDEWRKMIKEGTKYRITHMTTGDEGPAELRSRLNDRYRGISLTQVRRAMLQFSRNGKASKGIRSSRTTVDRVFGAIKRSDHNEREQNLSDEYKNYIAGEVWSVRARQHRRECDYRCQLCGRVRTGDLLHVHHVHYESFGHGKEAFTDLLCVCAEPCHMVADFMRRWGMSGGEWDSSLFADHV